MRTEENSMRFDIPLDLKLKRILSFRFSLH